MSQLTYFSTLVVLDKGVHNMKAMHCKICFLKQSHPGIRIGEDEICNLCKLEVPEELMENLKFAKKNYEIFRQSTLKECAKYECLFMYSGGKDSTYMLDKFVNKEKRTVLAYTFRIPFESEHAVENIQKVRSKIGAEYFVDSDDENIKKLMRYVFNEIKPKKPGRYLDEKLPCMLCRSFFVLRAINYAYKNKIPFIIFCADPQQIITTQSDIKKKC